MNKSHLVKGVIGGLIFTNLVTGYTFNSEYHKQQNKINKQSDQINRLEEINSERNSLIDTYRDKIIKINNQIQTYETKIDNLEKQLVKAKKRTRSSP